MAKPAFISGTIDNQTAWSHSQYETPRKCWIDYIEESLKSNNWVYKTVRGISRDSEQNPGADTAVLVGESCWVCSCKGLGANVLLMFRERQASLTLRKHSEPRVLPQRVCTQKAGSERAASCEAPEKEKRKWEPSLHPVETLESQCTFMGAWVLLFWMCDSKVNVKSDQGLWPQCAWQRQMKTFL